MAKITLSDIQGYAQIPTNIDGRLIDFQIDLARKLDLEPSLTKPLMEAVDYAVSNPSEKPQTVAFYEGFIIPYWSFSAYYRFISVHGTNVTQFGVTQANDPRGTFNQIDGDARATLLRQVKSDKDVFRQYMIDRLKEISYTLDGTNYTKSKTIENNQSMISSIKRKETRPFSDYNKRFL